MHIISPENQDKLCRFSHPIFIQQAKFNWSVKSLPYMALIVRIFVWKELRYRSFSSDVTAAILVYQNNEMAAILVYGTGISSFLFKYFVLFHHPTGATDHVSENDLYRAGNIHKRTHKRKQTEVKINLPHWPAARTFWVWSFWTLYW